MSKIDLDCTWRSTHIGGVLEDFLTALEANDRLRAIRECHTLFKLLLSKGRKALLPKAVDIQDLCDDIAMGDVIDCGPADNVKINVEFINKEEFLIP